MDEIIPSSSTCWGLTEWDAAWLK